MGCLIHEKQKNSLARIGLQNYFVAINVANISLIVFRKKESASLISLCQYFGKSKVQTA